MSDWSPKDAIAMERRHILEGEKRVARQEALVLELREKGRDHLAQRGDEILSLMRESLELSTARLRDLEGRFGEPLN
ncbi:MAG: hypothetical protein GEU92_07350 [Alphaproteobacteria bacterium]|nr:hypothetical protein [Alphaproteobacteria bacterium]